MLIFAKHHLIRRSLQEVDVMIINLATQNRAVCIPCPPTAEEGTMIYRRLTSLPSARHPSRAARGERRPTAARMDVSAQPSLNAGRARQASCDASAERRLLRTTERAPRRVHSTESVKISGCIRVTFVTKSRIETRRTETRAGHQLG